MNGRVPNFHQRQAAMKSLPPKQKTCVNGGTFEYITSGNGEPAVVLLNGSGGPVEGWYKVYAGVERLSAVFAYNRLGVGGSDRPNAPQTGDVIVATLRTLLTVAGLRPPYVLAGHSLGGLYANLFARQFPEEIAGVVMLDASAPKDAEMLRKYESRAQRAVQRVIDAIFPKDINGEVEFVMETVRQIEKAGPFPDVPLIVVSGSWRPPSLFMAPEVFRIRSENQKALCAMSRCGKQIIATRSGHFPQFSEPELVVEAIREVLEWWRDDRK